MSIFIVYNVATQIYQVFSCDEKLYQNLMQNINTENPIIMGRILDLSSCQVLIGNQDGQQNIVNKVLIAFGGQLHYIVKNSKGYNFGNATLKAIQDTHNIKEAACPSTSNWTKWIYEGLNNVINKISYSGTEYNERNIKYMLNSLYKSCVDTDRIDGFHKATSDLYSATTDSDIISNVTLANIGNITLANNVTYTENNDGNNNSGELSPWEWFGIAFIGAAFIGGVLWCVWYVGKELYNKYNDNSNPNNLAMTELNNTEKLEVTNPNNQVLTQDINGLNTTNANMTQECNDELDGHVIQETEPLLTNSVNEYSVNSETGVSENNIVKFTPWVQIKEDTYICYDDFRNLIICHGDVMRYIEKEDKATYWVPGGDTGEDWVRESTQPTAIQPTVSVENLISNIISQYLPEEVRLGGEDV